jgi:hypothetical protein
MPCWAPDRSSGFGIPAWPPCLPPMSGRPSKSFAFGILPLLTPLQMLLTFASTFAVSSWIAASPGTGGRGVQPSPTCLFSKRSFRRSSSKYLSANAVALTLFRWPEGIALHTKSRAAWRGVCALQKGPAKAEPFRCRNLLAGNQCPAIRRPPPSPRADQLQRELA